jgi:(p)ppGpp synthase/HD superfamily hydrolase
VELSQRFDAAFKLASNLHRTQTRKSTQIPYLSHLMAVSALVLEKRRIRGRGHRPVAPRRR